MQKLRLLAVAVALLAVAFAGAGASAAPPASPDAITVRFATRIVSGSDSNLPLVFDAVYDAKGSRAHFRISLANDRVVLMPVAGSQPRALLTALRKALGATKEPKAVKRARQLALDVVILDYKPGTGDILSKLFFLDDTGEVYLNLNLKQGWGEFSLKDEEYGNVVLAELAKVV